MRTLTSPALATLIIRQASAFVGLREVEPNRDWDIPSTPHPDSELVRQLKALMRPSPWQDGWAYCAAFCEGVVAAALFELGTGQQVERWRAVMGPHVVSAWQAFRSRGLVSAQPVPGAIWLARHGDTSNGHAGIVTAVREGGVSMATVEANTSLDATTAAKEREGDWITTRVRMTRGTGSLRTLGFVTPDAVIKLVTAA